MWYRKYILRALFVWLSVLTYESKAGSFLGTEITWRSLNSSGLYEVTVVYYNACDTSAFCANTCSGTCNFGLSISGVDTQYQQSNFGFITLSLVSVRDAYQPERCSGTRTTCKNMNCTPVGTFTPGIERFEFRGTVNLGPTSGIPSNCCLVRLYFTTCCRSNTVNNINVVGNYYGESIINRCLSNSLQNSSPYLTNDPFTVICSGQPLIYNSGAIDPDLDSLSYTFAPIRNGFNNTLPYNSPYAYNRPMPWSGPANGSFPAGISCHPINGDIFFTPNSGGNFSGYVNIEIKQWILNPLTGIKEYGGSVFREFISHVKSCSPNNPPTIKTFIPLASGTQLPITTNFEVCAGNSICFDVMAKDTDYLDTTFLSATGNVFGLGATFVKVDSASRESKYRFCWTPTTQMVNSSPYSFVVNAYDTKCPVPGTASRSIRIRVLPPSTISITQQPTALSACHNQSGSLSVNTNNNAACQFYWFKNGQPVGTSRVLQIDSANSTHTGKYNALIKTPCGILFSDTVELNIKPSVTPEITLTASRLGICQSDTVVFYVHNSDSNNRYTYLLQRNHVITGDTLFPFASTANTGNDTIRIRVVPNFPNCFSSDTLTSNFIVLLDSLFEQSVTINAVTDSICALNQVMFHAGISPTGHNGTVEWYKNNVLFGSGLSYTFQNIQSTDTIRARLISTDNCVQQPVVFSNPISLPTYAPFSYASLIDSLFVCSGTPVNLSYQLSGNTLHYQWYHQSLPIPFATDDTLKIQSIATGAWGAYRLGIMGHCDTLFTQPIHITVFPTPNPPQLSGPTVADIVNSFTYESNIYNNHNYIWSVDSGLVLSGQGTRNVMLRFYRLGLNEVKLRIVSPDDCENNSSYSVQTTSVGLYEGQGLSPVVLFPNPNSGSFKLSLHVEQQGMADIRILDPIGKTVWNQTRHIPYGQSDMDIQSDLKPGIYMLQLNVGFNEWISRLIIN